MIGLSIYPDLLGYQDTLDYLLKAKELGYKRVFTCLIHVKNLDEYKNTFQGITNYTHEAGMTLIADVAPVVFERLGLCYDDLSVFKELGLDGIRLDLGFGGKKEAELSRGDHGLILEVNGSDASNYIDQILDHNPNKQVLWTCHNFYPQEHTGLSLEYFIQQSKRLKALGLKTAAFVTSRQPNTVGPWPFSEGLPTLEMHRHLPIDLQARHLVAMGLVDDILIGNAFASDEELQALANVSSDKIEIRLSVLSHLSSKEKAILTQVHKVRGDLSSDVIRSRSLGENAGPELNIEPRESYPLHRGDVVILNNGYGRYQGELQIILKDMNYDPRRNLVGHIPLEEQILLDSLDSFKSFRFI
ncbi:MAG: MupG family TIM beta-alpha barrel fold protein [Erysipelotrichaceae bacterium]|jgi:hypothetical protein|nr:MupG family TIM beta-alpha barrel fold protein [Erysipelotrichaceae bacterium]